MLSLKSLLVASADNLGELQVRYMRCFVQALNNMITAVEFSCVERKWHSRSIMKHIWIISYMTPQFLSVNIKKQKHSEQSSLSCLGGSMIACVLM